LYPYQCWGRTSLPNAEGNKPLNVGRDKPFDVGRDKPLDVERVKPLGARRDKPPDIGRDKSLNAEENKPPQNVSSNNTSQQKVRKKVRERKSKSSDRTPLKNKPLV
jgi:hypothetical protein